MISVKKRTAYIRVDGEFHNRLHEVVLATEHDSAVAALSAEINALRAGKEFCGACGEGCESCRVLQESPDLAELAQARCEQQAKHSIEDGHGSAEYGDPQDLAETTRRLLAILSRTADQDCERCKGNGGIISEDPRGFRTVEVCICRPGGRHG